MNPCHRHIAALRGRECAKDKASVRPEDPEICQQPLSFSFTTAELSVDKSVLWRGHTHNLVWPLYSLSFGTHACAKQLRALYT